MRWYLPSRSTMTVLCSGHTTMPQLNTPRDVADTDPARSASIAIRVDWGEDPVRQPLGVPVMGCEDANLANLMITSGQLFTDPELPRAGSFEQGNGVPVAWPS